MSDELPQGWATARLDEIVENLDGRRRPVKSSERAKRAGQYPYYGASGPIDTINEYLFDGNYLLVAEDGANLLSRNTPIAFPASGRFWVNNHAHVLGTTGRVELRYLQHFLNSFDLQFIVTGSAQPKLTQAALNAIEVPVAPLAEQRRLVAKLESVLERLRTAGECVSKVPLFLRRFRQAVLAAATSGTLTAEWRAERELPDWTTVPLADLATEFSYGSATKSSKSGSVPVLRMGNIQEGQLDWTDLVFTSDAREIAKYRLRRGDVLFNRTNSPELVGKTAVFRAERDAIYAGYLIRVRCTDRLVPDFLSYCLNSPAGREFCAMVKTDGVSQSNINASKLAEFQLQLPSIDEQEEVVRRTERLLAGARRIQERQTKVSGAIGTITKSVLLKAFCGELVPTEAALARKEGRQFESAAQLLSRVVDQLPQAPIEKRNLPVKTTDEDAIAAAIRTLPVGQLSFDELRRKVPCEYELLRQVVFDLLAESPPALRQVFNERAKAMMLERVGG